MRYAKAIHNFVENNSEELITFPSKLQASSLHKMISHFLPRLTMLISLIRLMIILCIIILYKELQMSLIIEIVSNISFIYYFIKDNDFRTLNVQFTEQTFQDSGEKFYASFLNTLKNLSMPSFAIINLILISFNTSFSLLLILIYLLSSHYRVKSKGFINFQSIYLIIFLIAIVSIIIENDKNFVFALVVYMIYIKVNIEYNLINDRNNKLEFDLQMNKEIYKLIQTGIYTRYENTENFTYYLLNLIKGSSEIPLNSCDDSWMNSFISSIQMNQYPLNGNQSNSSFYGTNRVYTLRDVITNEEANPLRDPDSTFLNLGIFSIKNNPERFFEAKKFYLPCINKGFAKNGGMTDSESNISFITKQLDDNSFGSLEISRTKSKRASVGAVRTFLESLKFKKYSNIETNKLIRNKFNGFLSMKQPKNSNIIGNTGNANTLLRHFATNEEQNRNFKLDINEEEKEELSDLEFKYEREANFLERNSKVREIQPIEKHFIVEEKAVNVSLMSQLIKDNKEIREIKSYRLMDNKQINSSATRQSNFIIIISDVTNIILNQQYKVESKYKNIVMSKLAHELKTPCIAIDNYTTKINDEILELNEIQDLNRRDMNIYKQSEKIKILSDQIINVVTQTYNLIEGLKKSEINNEEIKLVEILNFAYIYLKTTIETNKSNQISTEIKLNEDFCNLCMFTDERKLKIVISEAIKNAVKFTNKGKISVEVELEKNVLILSIRDSGIGMTAGKLNELYSVFEEIEKDFTRFNSNNTIIDSLIHTSMLEKATQIINCDNVENFLTKGGLNLGLRIIKTFCLYLNIDLRLFSSPDEGTTISFILADVYKSSNDDDESKNARYIADILRKSSKNLISKKLLFNEIDKEPSSKTSSNMNIINTCELMKKKRNIKSTKLFDISSRINSSASVSDDPDNTVITPKLVFAPPIFWKKENSGESSKLVNQEASKDSSKMTSNLKLNKRTKTKISSEISFAKLSSKNGDKKEEKDDRIFKSNNNLKKLIKMTTLPEKETSSTLLQLKSLKMLQNLTLNNEDKKSAKKLHSYKKNIVVNKNFNISHSNLQNSTIIIDPNMKSDLTPKIIIVDDDYNCRKSLKNLLKNILKGNEIPSHSIIKASDGVDMLSLVINDFKENLNTVKLVISDENMNYINGSDSFQILNKMFSLGKIKRIPLIILTALENEEAHKIMKKNADTVLKKPVNKHVLINKLKKFLI